MLKLTVAKFEEAKPFANVVGGSYKANFDKTYGETVLLRDKMIDENRKVYYEAEADPESVPKPDPQNFVKTISIAEVLNASTPLDNQLRHLVPPAVRQMQEELTKMLQLIVQD